MRFLLCTETYWYSAYYTAGVDIQENESRKSNVAKSELLLGQAEETPRTGAGALDRQNCSPLEFIP